MTLSWWRNMASLTKKLMWSLLTVFTLILQLTFWTAPNGLGEVEDEYITMSITVHSIIEIDPIEDPVLPEFKDWQYFISVQSEDKWTSVNSSHTDCVYSEFPVEETHTFAVYSRYARIKFNLLDLDIWTRPDVADISGYPGGGSDNNDVMTRGTTFSGLYDTKLDRFVESDFFTLIKGSYLISGEDDGSTSVDENDASILFSISDDYEPPVANAGPDWMVEAGDMVLFDGTNSSASDCSSIVEYRWDLDDDRVREFSGPVFNYTFATFGEYNVTLKVVDSVYEWDTDVCTVYVTDSPPTASFTYSPESPTIESDIQFSDQSSDLDGPITSWFWEFGDGITSQETNPVHRYAGKGEYAMNLTVKDEAGNINVTSETVVVANIPPVARFKVTPTNVKPGDVVYFWDESSDREGEDLTYEWDFGDGKASNDRNPVHVYTESGLFEAALVVTDDEGASDTSATSVQVVMKHSLTVVLKDPLGMPVSGATVKLFSNGANVASGSTDEKGRAILLGIPEGEYQIRAVNLGLTSSSDIYLDESSISRLRVTASVYVVGLIVALIVLVSLVVYFMRRRSTPTKNRLKIK
jgi:PKD repeat protein